MKILILGGSGFLGKHLIKSYLTSEKINIYTVTRKPFEMDGVKKKYFGDVSNVDFLKNLINQIKPKIIFYLISDFTFLKNDNLSSYLKNSTIRTLNLSSAINNDMRIVYVGSAAQYGNVKTLKRKVVESDSFNPVTSYGLMKSFEEIQLRYLVNKYNFNIVYTRIFNLIGPGEPPMTVAGSMVSQLLYSNHIKHGNLSPERDFLDVRDAANALKIIGSKGKKDLVYNICSGSGTKIGDLLHIIIKTSGKKAKIEKNINLSKGIDIPKIIGCNKQLLKLGWIQRYSLENSVKDLIRFYLKHE